MAYPAHVAYVVRGNLPGGEVWSSTIRCSTDAGAPFAGLDLVQAVEDVLASWLQFDTFTSMLVAGVTLDTVTGYVYDPGPVLVEQATSVGAGRAGSAAVRLPNQCALVCTLRTDLSSRRTRGRLFLPALGLTVIAGNVIATATAQLYAGEMAAHLERVGAAGFVPPASMHVSVVSAVGVPTAADPGTQRAVTQVSVGTVIDTQRRRRGDVQEVYANSPVTVVG